MPIADDCCQRFDAIAKSIKAAYAQWSELEKSLEEADTQFLQARMGSWEKWFGLMAEDLEISSEGSLIHTVRVRIQTMVVEPLLERMSQRISFFYPAREGEDPEDVEKMLQAKGKNRVLAALVLHFERNVEPVLKAAKKEDNELMKKIRKTERDERKQGVMALSGDTKKVAALKRQQPAIWETSEMVLESIKLPMQKVTAFFEDDFSPDMMGRLISSVPAIVSRALCDWQFERCVVDFEQLEEWWAKALATLQGQEEVWQALYEREGYLVRRIERGMEELRTRRQRYSMYANFGGENDVMKWFANDGGSTAREPGAIPAKLEESINLLATVVSDMQKRLKAIRDSALWRVIDMAQDIFKEQHSPSHLAELPPWQAVRAGDGITALLEVLETDENGASAQPDPSDTMDAALAVMGRLERLIGLCRDLQVFFRKPPPLDGAVQVCDVLEELVGLTASLNEDLLGLLDDPTERGVQAWLRQWARLGAGNLGQRLGQACAALPLRPDAELPPGDERRQRRQWLVLARGLQAFLEDDMLRGHTVASLSGVRIPATTAGSDARAANETQEAGAEIFALQRPPSPRQMQVPQDANYAYRPPDRRSNLLAETPSTTCDEASIGEGSRPMSSKFVDGQLITVRPTSAGQKLPPLSPQSAASPLSSASASAGRRSKVLPGGGGGAHF